MSEGFLNRRAHPVRLWSIVVLGVVGVLAAIGYAMHSQGKFKSREKVAVLTWTEDTFWEPTEKGAQDAAEEFGVDLQFVRSKPDEATQTKHIQDLLGSGIVGLAVAPNNPKTQEAVLNEAAGKVKLVTFDSDAPNTKRHGFVGTDDYAAGRIAAAEVRAAMPDGAKVLITVGSIELTNGADRRRGVIDDLLDRPFNPASKAEPVDARLEGKNYQVVATVIDNANVEATPGIIAEALKKHPEVNCIVGLFSYSAPSAVKAAETVGRKGQIKIIGFDESPDEQAAVRDGVVYSSILQNQYRCGYETVRVLAELVRGIEQPNGPTGARLTALPVKIMHADNIEELQKTRVIRKVDSK